MTPTVGYDARMALGRHRGMGAWLRSLLQGRERQMLGFCAAGERDAALRLSVGGIRFFPAWEQLSLPRALERAGIETFLAPFNTAPLRLPARVRLILAVHDLIFLEDRRALPYSRSPYQNAGRLYRRFVTPRAIRRAAHIVTVSQTVRQQVLQRFGLEPARVSVVPNTIRPGWFEARKLAPPGRPPAILAISGEAPSKNLARALHGFASLERAGGLAEGTRLVIAGVSPGLHDYFAGQARKAGLRCRPVWLPYLPEAELEEQVRAATLVFVPSLFEGFGRPVLEAMACGTPCVAASLPVLQEVGGAAAAYCDPHSPEAMAEALARVLADPVTRQAMSTAGRLQAARFHPDCVRTDVERFRADILRLEDLSSDTA